MKKTLLLLVALVLSGAAMSQTALGVRLGGGSAFNGEISGQFGMGSANRIEADLGFSSGQNWSYIGLTGVYQWRWDIANMWGWYVGPGVNIGFASSKDAGAGLGLAVCGQIGVEFTPNIPFQFTIDIRPSWHFLGRGDALGFGWGGALGVRYKF